MAVEGRTPAQADTPERLTRALKRAAADLGFAKVGVARAEALGREAEVLREWLARGYQGEMGYMQDTAAVRCDPRDPRMLAGAQSVLVVAAPYAGAGPAPDLAPGRVARYAWGRDYHNVLGKRLRKLATRVRERGHAARVAVDTLPVLERAWAQRAGLGFIGKNCCLIVPGLGSHLFLGAVVTDARLVADAPMEERCGSCTRCLDACPTRAFAAPRLLDARRCIAYLTIEQRGAIPTALRAGVGEWVFGCDVCQDVCPYNAGRANRREGDAAFAARRWGDMSASELLALDEAGFARWAEGSPLRRARREGLARNAAVVLGNRGGRKHLPVLRHSARHDPSPVVRESSRWAVARIEARGTTDDDPDPTPL